MGPPKKDDISSDKTILMTSLRIYRASAMSSLRLHYTTDIDEVVEGSGMGLFLIGGHLLKILPQNSKGAN